MKKLTQSSDEKPESSTDFEELRRQAEARYNLSYTPRDLPLSEADIQRLVHELQVHQIELEIQNEELQRTRNELETWLERYTDLYDFAPVGYFTLKRNGEVSQVNQNGAQLLGLDHASLVGRRFGLFLAAESQPIFNAFLTATFEGQIKQTCEILIQKEGGDPFWVQIEASKIDNSNECRTVVIDIQARKNTEIKLRHLSMHDTLTGLYNRSYFEESMEKLEHGRQFPISILRADLNHMKITNDREVHASGDALLKRVAQVLTTAFRAEDVIARIGRDEFAVLLPNTDLKAAEFALLRLCEVLRDHNSSYFTNPPLQLSLGISTAAEYGNSLMETLREADAALYGQKRG